MVQILPSNNKRSFSQGLIGGLSQSLPDAFERLIERKRQGNILNNQLQRDEEFLNQENEALEALGHRVTGVRNPKIRQALLDQGINDKKTQLEQFKSEESKKAVEDIFGSEFAKLWESSPVGGQTELLKAGLDALVRGENLNKLLSPYTQQLESIQNKQIEMDFDKGLNPKERVSREEKRYDKNLPLFQDSQKRLSSLENEQETINILDELNETGKLPSGAGRWNVSIKEGNLIVPALANAETQRYIKTVNEFLNKAKDTFGARVTNFELDRFLQRLPTLANTEEGRREILKQMRFFNTIQAMYEEELQNVIDESGGVRKIDFDRAESIAKKRIEPQIQEYKKEFKEADKRSQQTYEDKINDYRKKVPTGSVLVEKDGRIGFIPKKNLFKAQKAGYKKL